MEQFPEIHLFYHRHGPLYGLAPDFFHQPPDIRIVGIEGRAVDICPVDNIRHGDFFKLLLFQQIHKSLPDKSPGANGAAVFLFLCHRRLHSLKTIKIRFCVGFPNSLNILMIVRKP